MGRAKNQGSSVGFLPLIAWVGVVTSCLMPQAFAQVSISTVRIHDRGPDLYRQFTSTCADALKSNLDKRGISAKVDQLGGAKELEAREQGPGYPDVDVWPSGVEPLTVRKPNIAFLVESYSPFRDVSHFQAFLNSRLYEAALRERPSSSELNDSIIRPLAQSLWLGWAYLGTTQLFSADTPLVQTSDLRGRTLFSEFSSVSLLRLHSDLGFGYNSELAHAPTTLDGQRSVLSKLLTQANRSSVLVAQPLALGDAVIPDAYKRFVSLANWHVMVISFLLRQPWLHEGQIDDLQRTIREAALDCSRQNFDSELAALDKLKREGTTVVTVNAPAFHDLTLKLLKNELDDAIRQETSAKQAWDRKSAEIAAAADENNKSKKSEAAQASESSGAEVGDLLRQMHDLFDFEHDPTPTEERNYDDAVDITKTARQRIEQYNRIQELK